MLGIALNAAAEMSSLYLGIRLYLRFPGTFLVTFLCGAYPGMLAEAGSMLLQYGFEALQSGIGNAPFTIPIPISASRRTITMSATTAGATRRG